MCRAPKNSELKNSKKGNRRTHQFLLVLHFRLYHPNFSLWKSIDGIPGRMQAAVPFRASRIMPRGPQARIRTRLDESSAETADWIMVGTSGRPAEMAVVPGWERVPVFSGSWLLLRDRDPGLPLLSELSTIFIWPPMRAALWEGCSVVTKRRTVNLPSPWTRRRSLSYQEKCSIRLLSVLRVSRYVCWSRGRKHTIPLHRPDEVDLASSPGASLL